jgi:hypothetical protein
VEYVEIMRLVPILLSGLVIVACSGATTTIGGDDTADGSPGDSGGSSSGGLGDGSTSRDGGNGGGRDAGATDGGTSVDATLGDDAGTADQVIVTINVTDLFQDCQPIVREDPVQMKGSITVQNNTRMDVGPITMTDGAFYDANKARLATFKVTPASIPLVAPGAGGSADIVKAQPSMVPADGCNTLPCQGQYIVEVTLNAPQLGTYQARTVPIAIQCPQ